MKLSRLRRFILEASWDKSFGMQILASSGIRNWLAQYDIDNPKFIGEGGLGYAYRDGNKVVKLTADTNEAMVATKLVNKPAHKNLTRIYGVKKYGLPITNKLGVKRDIYLIVQDAVETNISNDLAEAADMVGGYLDVYSKKPPFDDINAMLDECLSYQEINKSSPIANLIYKLFNIIQSIYEETGLNYVDVARGNIGFGADGEIKFFDYGLSELI